MDVQGIGEILELQRKNQWKLGQSSAKERRAKLRKLQHALLHTFRKELQAAVFQDLGKPHLETDLTEIYPTVSEIRMAVRELSQWMKPKRVDTPLTLIGSKSYIVHRSKGCCLILAPWNFPINLSLIPLVSAIAAGNAVVLKPSELAPNTAKVIAQLVESIFDRDEVAVVQGEVSVAQQLLKQPFDHIFFTGSTAVGKEVMKAASEHLASITLELGGKSPAVILPSANLKKAAKRIAWGKFLNCGQVCLAPDYVLVPQQLEQEFLGLLQDQLLQFFGSDARESDSYGRMVSAKHMERLVCILRDAKDQGATIAMGGQYDEMSLYMAPTIITQAPDGALVWQEELFGPLLPVSTYTTVEEAIDLVQKRENPLAIYLFGKSSKDIKRFMMNTQSGSVCLNNTVVQFSNPNFPFGGTNHSGQGRYHGYHGFVEFSNVRSIMRQQYQGTSEFLFPPYSKVKQAVVNLLLKWF